MSALLSVPGLGKATQCVGAKHHSPVPTRFVWHHVLPQEAGGTTTPDNLVDLCDSCHYTAHAVLWALAKGHTVTRRVTPALLEIARRGYLQAQLLNTVAKIPNEGGSVIS